MKEKCEQIYQDQINELKLEAKDQAIRRDIDKAPLPTGDVKTALEIMLSQRFESFAQEQKGFEPSYLKDLTGVVLLSDLIQFCQENDYSKLDRFFKLIEEKYSRSKVVPDQQDNKFERTIQQALFTKTLAEFCTHRYEKMVKNAKQSFQRKPPRQKSKVQDQTSKKGSALQFYYGLLVEYQRAREEDMYRNPSCLKESAKTL